MVRLLLLALGLCALAQINAAPMRLEKRIYPYAGPAQLEKRAPYEKRLIRKSIIEKRHPALAVEKRSLAVLEKRAPIVYQLEKRQKAIKRNLQPAQTVYYYYQLPDGSFGQAAAPQVQEPLIQGYQEVPYQAPASSGGSGSGLFTLLSKPFSTVGKVVGLAGDVVQGVVDVPFSVAKDVVQGVGLGDSTIGKAATGILDAGSALVKAPVELVKNVGQLPFELVSNVVGSLDGEE